MQLYFVVIIFGLLVGGFILSSVFSKKARIKRKLKKAPVKPISTFMSGETAKIVGKVEFTDTPLTAPLTGRQCAYYYVCVEQRVSSGKSSHWRKIIEEEVSGKYVVRDGNKCAFVNDPKPKSYIVQDQHFRSGFLKDADENLERFLNKHGYKSEGLFGFNNTLRYREGVLEMNEAVSVYGKGEWKSGSQLGLTANYDRVLVMSPPDGEHVYLSDDPGTVKMRSGESKYI